MKSDIHPQERDVIFQDTTNESMFKIQSSVATKLTVEVDGVEYPLVRIDVTSASHPFYTGQTRILDTAGRVEKFGSKYGSLSNLKKKK
ncbi:MAG: type B 50S ribosomal protein L31 [Planctomycetes bacterium]|nr:type B 50S ribosomal protein L31 [Planctomycetota bacterium]